MGELKNEFEDISLEDEPQLFGRSVNGIGKEPYAKDLPQLPTLCVSASLQSIHKQHKSAKVRVRDALQIGMKVVGVGGMVLVLLMAAVGRPSALVHDASTRSHVMSALFLVGLLMVALEDFIELSKSAIMLLLAATLWTILAVGYEPSESEAGAHRLHHELNRGLQDVGSVVLFLLPAMGVVESIDHFGGFHIVTLAIRKGMDGKKVRLTAIICILTFFLSSVIDNLTSTIVAIKILRHIVPDDDEWRRQLGGLVVIAANAGGAWSPIGDVTTTMLWIQGKITATKTVQWLFLPSLVSGLFPLVGIYLATCRRSPGKDLEPPARTCRTPRLDDEYIEGSCELEEQPLRPDLGAAGHDEEMTSTKILSLAIGVFVILLVPVLKIWTGLPPYLGMLLALGLMWLTSDLLNFDPAPSEGKDQTLTQRGVVAALYKIDLTGLLFFTGVLLSVGALDSAGVLHAYATMLVRNLGQSPVALCTLLGLSSAVVDNVPLVEASIDMFRDVPTDDKLWQLVALAAGTGGSILSVGSIAGVTLMSMEGVGFLWYCKRISMWAALGFFFGIATYHLQSTITDN